MHNRGRRLLRHYPCLVVVDDKDDWLAICEKYPKIRTTVLDEQTDLFLIADRYVPVTMPAFDEYTEYRFYLFFEQDHPKLLEFKLKYSRN